MEIVIAVQKCIYSSVCDIYVAIKILISHKKMPLIPHVNGAINTKPTH